jgi:hypothetical protein
MKQDGRAARTPVTEPDNLLTLLPSQQKKRKEKQSKLAALPITSHPISETQSKLAVSPSEQSRG